MDSAHTSDRPLTPRRRRVRIGERGQMLVLTGFMLFVMLGLAAMAVDLGTYMGDRRDLQNDADAIALAGARDLPSEAEAVASANDWAVKNGIVSGDDDLDNGEIDSIQVYQQSLPDEPNPRISVTLKRNHGFIFAKVLGISEATVEATASAIKTSPAGGAGVVPWSVEDDAIGPPGDEVIIKYDANKPQNGNFGPIRIDGSGGGSCDLTNKYCRGVKYGSETVICADGVLPPDPDGEPENGCQETAPGCDGVQCDSEPGNKVGSTRTAVDWRMDNTVAECDTFEEAFSDNGDGTYTLAYGCNPWLAGGEGSKRVMIIPIIDELGNGSSPVTILEFGLFWLDGYDAGKCTGNDCEIKGRFVNAHVNVGALAGVYDPDSAIHFVRLVE